MNTYPSQHDETVLSELQAHEAEVLRLHEQYLRIEEEYARALSQVTSLQTELVKKSAGDLSAVLPLFESLERSMTRFHDHQAETLQVHRHYLETQEAISQLFLPGAAAPVAGQEPAAAVPAPATVTTQPIVENRPVLARLEHPSPAAYPKSNGHAAQAAAVMPHQPIAPEVQPERKPAAPTPLAAGDATIDPSGLREALLEIVSEKTGYPVETLEMDMDMEADLGIDSIKRVEILGAMQDRFPALPKLEAAALAELRTLGQIISQMNQAQPVSPLSPSVGGTAQSPFDFAVNQPLDLSRAVRKILPPPDRMEFRLPEGHSCLVTDDGSPLTGRLVQQLSNLGWPVVVMRFPGVLRCMEKSFPPRQRPLSCLSSVKLSASQPGKYSLTYGPIAVFIHLSPAWKSASELGVNSSPGEKELLKMVFLAAKHLKATLTATGEQGRAAFFTVTRLDGEFGLSQEADFSPVSGGLLGLAKTLKLEWNEVHCRALDLSPILDAQQAAGCILAELHDPNRLISEVGYTLTERSTLALAPLALPVPIPQV
jgi:acyl carrier protein